MAHVLSQKWLLNRLHFLKGLGVSMAPPMLQCMRPLRAAEASAQPKRSVFIYLPNGVNTYDYQLEEEGPNYTFSTILAPLEPHRSQFSPINGLYHPNAFGVAHDAPLTRLTGAKHGPSDKNSISVDQYLISVREVELRTDCDEAWLDTPRPEVPQDLASSGLTPPPLTDLDGVNNSDFGPRNRKYQAVPNPFWECCFD